MTFEQQPLEDPPVPPFLELDRYHGDPPFVEKTSYHYHVDPEQFRILG
jgi:hypothetical protein